MTAPENGERPDFDKIDRPTHTVDYRQDGGPKLTYLWCEQPLSGQQLYLGGEVGCDGRIWFIPGHANRVLVLDPVTDVVQLVGPELPGKFKWLRGVPIGECIYGLPCHADSVLRIHVPTETITTIPIPYEHEEDRLQEWKYHGGNTSPLDGCIYAIPQSARQVLKVDPTNDSCSLFGPFLEGRWKWYGGVIGEGAIYGIPHDSPSVLRIHPEEGVTLHGNYGTGGHKWHGAAAAPDGTIVCVPANANTVLNITPGSPAPTLWEMGDSSIIQTGRHRSDEKYKYLGATTGPDGKVYIFPSGSEYVLQVDPAEKVIQNVGPNLYPMERLFQNKWQNGVATPDYVYAIPLAGESLLRIHCESMEITTWPLPRPHKCLGKFEGGVLAPNGIVYTVPNNHKAVLRIEAPGIHADDDRTIYRSGIPTLRSSSHRVKFNPKNRKHDPKPRNRWGDETGTLWLPDKLLKELVFPYDTREFDVVSPLKDLLQRCDSDVVGSFRDGSNRFEDFVIPVDSTWRKVNGGHCEDAQRYLSEQVETDEVFLNAFDKLVQGFVLPHLKARLVAEGAISDEPNTTTFYYQRPPTIRLQPGPARARVKAHNDAEYGHQNGELNFWIPFTDRALTGVDLWCESDFNAGDFSAVAARPGEIISFHGSSRRHYVNTNETMYTRVSMDFRVGVQGFFDPYWQMKGTTDDHGRKEVTL